MGSKRLVGKRKKRVRVRWGNVFLLLFFLAGSAGVYFYFQYRAGLAVSMDETGEKQEIYEFDGKRDASGATNILLLGSDSREGEGARTDTMMIASYHPEKETYKLISIMRDTYVSIPGHGKHKLNAAFALGGPELLRQTISENFGVELQYYAVVDFKGFISAIDTAFPNGVEIDVEQEMSKNIGVTLYPGVQKLNGEELLGYVRFRQDGGGDFNRVDRQQKALKEIGSQITSIQTLTKLPKLIGVVTPYVNTNLGKKDMLSIASGVLSTGRPEIQSLRLPVEGSYQNQRVSGAGLILAIDMEQNRQELKRFLIN